MLVEEIGRGVEVYGSPVISGLLEGTLLTGIAYGAAVRHAVVDVSANADVMLRSEGRAEHKVLPVGLRTSGKFPYTVAGGCACREYLRIEVHHFRRRHDRNLPRRILETERAAVAYLGLSSHALPGGDKNDSV